MPEHGVLADAADRARISSDLATTMFVEAGAGTGKTRALVERLVALVREDKVALDSIAAITFTDAAAGELRSRVRERLIELAADEVGAPVARAALAQIDEAAITTIHGFAQRLLSDDPLAVGLPLRLRVIDEVEADLAFERHFESFLDQLFEEPAAVNLVAAALSIGISLWHLRGLAEQMEERWHLYKSAGDAGVDLAAVIDSASAEVRIALHEAVAFSRHCVAEDDRLLEALNGLQPVLRAFPGDGGWLDRLRWLVGIDVATAGNAGKKPNWQGCNVSDVRDALAAARALRAAALATVSDVVLRALLDRLAAAAAAAAAERRRRGELSFHDLLLCCRDLLRDHPAARRSARRRWRHVLVDEFQDTDPLQYEIVQLLGTSPESGLVEPGRLFFVGDPKQAIYRFRGADVSLYSRARDDLDASGRARLVTNFRSVPDVLGFVNGVFSRLLADDALGGYPALLPARQGSGAPAVHLLGGPRHSTAEQRREEEAALVAGAIAGALEEGWLVDGEDGVRPLRLSDIALLVTRRTALTTLEAALDSAALPYRLASGGLVYACEEVSELLACLAAIEEPADERTIVAALRTPAFACDDEALLEYRQAGGSWRLGSPPDDLAGMPVGVALAALGDLRQRRHALGVAGTLEALVSERRLRQLAAARRRPEEAWRRINFLLGEARAFAAAGGEGLGGFLHWARRQAAGRTRRLDPAPPADEDDSVQILTVHAAKGLEFPVVVLAELGSRPRPLAGPTILVGAEAPAEAKVRADLTTSGYAAFAADDEAAGREEELRLGYVAATRARDHLVVSLVHEPATDPTRATLAERIFTVAPEVPAWRTLHVRAARRNQPAAADDLAAPEVTLADYAAWSAGRAALLRRLGRPLTLAPSALGAGPDDGGEAGDGPPRAATEIGRAVHAVLERIELSGDPALETIAAWAAERAGCPERALDVARLVGLALGAPAVRAAAVSPMVRRELPITVPTSGGIVDGVIDLCYVEGDELVLVDYKTDELSGEHDVLAAASRYRLQAGAYALALGEVLGRPVGRVVLLFLAPPAGVVEHVVEDLPGALAEARAELAAQFAAT